MLGSSLSLYLLSLLVCVQNVVSATTLDMSKVFEPDPPVTHRVFMTIQYFDRKAQKTKDHDITIDVYGTVVPKTVFNFVSLADGVKARIQGQDPNDIKTLGYKGTLFTQIIPNGMIMGGDVIPEIGPFSVHGPAFPDENFILQHDRPGRLSMANNGPDSNNSKFFISTKLEPAVELDGRHVVFGQVVGGLQGLLDNVQNVEVGAYNKPVQKVVITQSVANELKIANPEDYHVRYLQKLEKFRSGDTSEGVAMGSLLADSNKKGKPKGKGKKSGAKSGTNPIVKAFYVVIGLGLLYVLFKFAKKNLHNKSNVVSMRHD